MMPATNRLHAVHILPGLLLSCLFACDRPVETTAVPSAEPRIASLSPALTSMVVDLGLGEHVVGRSGFCRAVDDSIPVVGDLLQVDYEMLVRVRPTHVLVQGTIDNVNPGLRQVAEDRGWELLARQLDGVDDIRSTLEVMPAALLRDESTRADAMARVDERLRQLDATMSEPVPELEGRNVLILSPSEPPLAWGRGTWLGQMLEQMGASNAIENDGWVSLSWEDLLRINADQVVLASLAKPNSDTLLIEMLSRLDSNCSIDVLIHPNIDLPASDLPGIAASFRTVLLQPTCRPAPEESP